MLCVIQENSCTRIPIINIGNDAYVIKSEQHYVELLNAINLWLCQNQKSDKDYKSNPSYYTSDENTNQKYMTPIINESKYMEIKSSIENSVKKLDGYNKMTENQQTQIEKNSSSKKSSLKTSGQFSNFEEIKGSIVENSEIFKSRSKSVNDKVKSTAFNKNLLKPPIINYSDLSKQINNEEEKLSSNKQNSVKKYYKKVTPVKDLLQKIEESYVEKQNVNDQVTVNQENKIPRPKSSIIMNGSPYSKTDNKLLDVNDQTVMDSVNNISRPQSHRDTASTHYDNIHNKLPGVNGKAMSGLENTVSRHQSHKESIVSNYDNNIFETSSSIIYTPNSAKTISKHEKTITKLVDHNDINFDENLSLYSVSKSIINEQNELSDIKNMFKKQSSTIENPTERFQIKRQNTTNDDFTNESIINDDLKYKSSILEKLIDSKSTLVLNNSPNLDTLSRRSNGRKKTFRNPYSKRKDHNNIIAENISPESSLRRSVSKEIASLDHKKVFYSISVFGEIIGHDNLCENESKHCGKMIFGVVDCHAVDFEYKHFYIAYNKGCLVKFCLESFEIELDLGKVHERRITSIAVTHSCKDQIITSSIDRHIKVFHKITGMLLLDIMDFEKNQTEITCMCLTHDHKHLIAAFQDTIEKRAGKERFNQVLKKFKFGDDIKLIRHFGARIKKGQKQSKEQYLLEMMDLDEGHEDNITSMVVTNDNQTLITGGDAGIFMEWDIPSAALLRKYNSDYDGCAINDMITSPDSKFIFTIGDDCTVNCIDLRNPVLTVLKFKQLDERCIAIGISKDSKFLFIGTEKKVIYKLDIESKEIVFEYETNHAHNIQAIILPKNSLHKH